MRYEAKLFLSFDANDDTEARNALDMLMGDLGDALDVTSQALAIGASLAVEDGQPEPVED